MAESYKAKFVSKGGDRVLRAWEPALFWGAVTAAPSTNVTLDAIEVDDVLYDDVIQDINGRCEAIAVGYIEKTNGEEFKRVSAIFILTWRKNEG